MKQWARDFYSTETRSINLSRWWKANKKYIYRNWKLPHIKEKYNHSTITYAANIVSYINNSEHINADMDLNRLIKHLYTTLN